MGKERKLSSEILFLLLFFCFTWEFCTFAFANQKRLINHKNLPF